MKKNILAIQMRSVIGDVDTNFRRVEAMFEEFYSHERALIPDIVVLPEVWTAGWACDVFQKCKDNEYKTEHFLAHLAKKYNVNIIGGSYIKETDGVCKNTCPVLIRDGQTSARYEKIHLYAPDGEADAVSAGSTPVVVDIEGLKIGLSICYDIRFPELFRSYINSDFCPDMMINMSAWPMTRCEQYVSMAQSRAIENQCFFLALSQTGEIRNGVYNSGNSVLVEPMGKAISRLGVNESYILAQIDTNVVENVRKKFPNLQNRRVYDFGFKPEKMGIELYV